MGKIIHARLDRDSEDALNSLVRRLEQSESVIIRRAILEFMRSLPSPKSKRIVGIGKFSSGISDLASNKIHLKGFGK